MDEVSFALPRLGITLRGQRTANRSGPLVLCLHGWLDNCVSFTPLLERMPEVNFVAVDLPGHGLSDDGPAAMYDILDYAACVLELAHSQQWERFQLIGHSLGGVVAAVTAGIHPERVSRLVLIDIIGLFTSSPEQTWVRVAGYLDAYLRDEDLPRYPTRRQAVQTRAQLGDMALETAETLSERDLREVAGGYAWRTDRRLKYPFSLTFTDEQMHTFLRHIKAPTLRVVADRAVPMVSLCHGMADSVPNLRTATVSGGHHLHMENVDRVAEVLRDFLVTT